MDSGGIEGWNRGVETGCGCVVDVCAWGGR